MPLYQSSKSFEDGLQCNSSCLVQIKVQGNPAQVMLILKLNPSRAYCSHILAFLQGLEKVSYTATKSKEQAGRQAPVCKAGRDLLGEL